MNTVIPSNTTHIEIGDGTPWLESDGNWYYWWGFKWLPYVGPKTKSFYAKFRSV